VIVKNKSGNQYPVKPEYEYIGESIYEQLINDAHDNKMFWGWIVFDQDEETPTLEDYTRANNGEGPPEDPPGERGRSN